MLRVYLCLTTQHDWRLVAVALAACALASCSAFFLYARAPLYPRRRALGWICAASLVAGSGIWTTHFVSMLAFRTGLAEGYDAAATIASFAAAVAASAVGFTLGALPGRGVRLIAQRLAGGATIGLGVSVMHYLGMAGFRTAGYLIWRQDLVIASVAIGLVLPAAALVTVWPGAGLRRQLAAAALLMAGIGGMHFTAMAAAGVVPDLEDLIEFFNAECAAGGFPAGPLNDARIEAVKAAIVAIESAAVSPPLRSLSEPVSAE